MTHRERTLVGFTLAAGVVAAMAWGFVRIMAARDAADSAARALADCEGLARRIEAARGPVAPAGATAAAARAADLRDAKQPEMARRIADAAREAELPEGSIDRIVPGPPRRLGDRPFIEHSTAIELRGVNLRQLFTFLHALSSGAGAYGAEGTGVGLKDIRLTAPPGDAAADLWNVDGTLTHTTYAPKETPPAR